MRPHIVLTPVQQEALNGLLEGISVGGVLVLRGEAGSGKTLILESLHSAKGGALIGAREFLSALTTRDPGALEEAFLRMIEDAMQGNDLVMIDDLHLVTNIVHARSYPRTYLLDAALTALLAEARAMNKTLLFASCNDAPWPVQRRAYTWEIDNFTAADHEQICRAHLPEAPLDFPASSASLPSSMATNSPTRAYGWPTAQNSTPTHSSSTSPHTTGRAISKSRRYSR